MTKKRVMVLFLTMLRERNILVNIKITCKQEKEPIIFVMGMYIKVTFLKIKERAKVY